MKTLTIEQQKLVEDNINLAYSFVQKYSAKYTTIAFDDKLSLAFLGLCNAARTYDKNRGTAFSSYAYVAIANQFNLELRAQNKHKPEGTVVISLYDTIHDLDDDTCTLEDIIENSDDVIEIQEFKIRFKEEYNKLSDRNKLIINLLCLGYTHYQVLEILKKYYNIELKQPTISRIRTKFINAIKS